MHSDFNFVRCCDLITLVLYFSGILQPYQYVNPSEDDDDDDDDDVIVL